MEFPLVFFILLVIANNKFIFTDTGIYQSIQDDLRNMNITCPNKHNCLEARRKDGLGKYSCHCSQFCTRLNSCCYDSPYKLVKPPEVVQTCAKISKWKGYFRVDRCLESDSVWKRLCHEEWNGEDDAVKLVPVTSLYTHITYKNYYCFRCHEAVEDFVYWDVKLESNSTDFDVNKPINDSKVTRKFMVDRCPESDSDSRFWVNLCHQERNGEYGVVKLIPVTSLLTNTTYKNYFCFRCHESGHNPHYWEINRRSSEYETADGNKVSLNYDPTYRTWVAPLGKGGALISVNISIERPAEFHELIVECIPDVVSNCSHEWKDKDVSDKCEAYMAMVCITRDNETYIRYRNAHCALCNFEDPAKLACDEPLKTRVGGKKPFSFTHLLDIGGCGDEVGKVCCEKDYLWDPFAKRCRKLTCALPGFVIRDGKCTPP